MNALKKSIWRAGGSRTFLLTTAIIGVALRVWWIGVNTDAVPAISDDLNYFHGAHNLLHGKGYSSFGAPIMHWPIGYSVFLSGVFAVFGATTCVAYVANMMLTVASAFLLWIIVQRWFKSKWVANAAAALCLLNPDQILMCPFVRSEPLHQALFYLLLLGLSPFANHYRLGRSLVIGVLTGLVCYVRPEYIILPAIWLMAEWWLHKDHKGGVGCVVKNLLLVYTVVAVVTLPANLRLKRLTGQWYFMSTAGNLAFFHGNNPYVACGGSASTMNELLAPDQSPRDYAIQYIKEHPVRFLMLMPLKFWNTYGIRMAMGAPTDALVINKIPDRLSPDEVGRALDRMNDGDKALFRNSLNPSKDGKSFIINPRLTSVEKTQFQHMLLTTFTYQFPTPPGWVLLRWAYRIYRIVQFTVLLVALMVVLGHSVLRLQLATLSRPWVALIALAGISSVYVICAGGTRYGYAQVSIFWAYFAFACCAWLKSERHHCED